MSPNVVDLWADMLIEAQSQAPHFGASLIRLVEPDDSPDQVEVGLLPLDGAHPADFLEGFRAPPSWVALGVAGGGWAAPLDAVRPSAHPEARRVIHVVLVARDGTVAGRIRYPDGTIMASPPTHGAVLDGLRGALGLA